MVGRAGLGLALRQGLGGAAALLCGPEAPGRVVCRRFNVDLSLRDLRCCLPPEWLNDEVVNFYCRLLNERAARTGPKSYFFSSFFLEKLMQRGYTYASVQRWTQRAGVNVFELDLVFMPWNAAACHWALVVIDMRERCIAVYDSAGAGAADVLDHRATVECVHRWLKDERQALGAAAPGGERFRRQTVRCPQQDNGSDCGVFALAFAERIALGRGVDGVTAATMPHWRRQIALQCAAMRI